ncbi:protein O-linked-mannose beta-1,4-N-acetylglucosaminyltransferase 2-like [Tachypleus tridentatus]|uniref:protein O-linked-mannose beta-1,4-N-acetylglucosaminyltransferase 2-like n=1 Tax=Tachypleus tridentatus TaxID=6853 RepID=UPI003FD04C0E
MVVLNFSKIDCVLIIFISALVVDILRTRNDITANNSRITSISMCYKKCINSLLSNGNLTGNSNANSTNVTSAEERKVKNSVDNKGIREMENITFGNLKLFSSVWCYGLDNTNRLCRFRNLCYFPKTNDFVFFHGSKSVYFGIPENQFNPALVDMASVENHNTQYFHFTDMPESESQGFNKTFFDKRFFIFNRFNPGNLMHVLHDDLIPLISSVREICGAVTINETQECLKSFELFLADEHPSGMFFNLYEELSAGSPLLATNLTDNICFAESFVGLRKHTLWYQYGFKIPQGPLKRNMKLVSDEVKIFIEMFRVKFGKKYKHTDDENYAVLIARNNRIIINEAEVMKELHKCSGLKVKKVSLEENNLHEIIQVIHNSKMLVGMHGALLALLMFLKPNSVVIELFPYGVNPDSYTPYKTLATLPGFGLIYHSWQNTELNNTITKPDNPVELGGIRHLPLTVQQQILDNPEVPQHLCCNNPEWLFRIYQDTVVNISSFSQVLQHALLQQVERKTFQQHNENLMKRNLYPGEVQNLACHLVYRDETWASLVLLWKEPWNLKYINSSLVVYEVLVQEANTEKVDYVLVKTTKHIFHKLLLNTHYVIWLRCQVDGRSGHFSTYPLHCYT